MSFFKLENEAVLEAPNFVLNKDYELRVEEKDNHTYPVDGWYWFETKEEAYDYFGLDLPEDEIEPLQSA